MLAMFAGVVIYHLVFMQERQEIARLPPRQESIV